MEVEGRKGKENQLVLSRLWAMQFHEASHPGIHLTIYHLSDPLSIHQSDHLSLDPSAFHPSIHPSLDCLFVHLSVYLSIIVSSIHHLTVHPSMYPLINVSTHPSIHFYVICQSTAHQSSQPASHPSTYSLSTFPLTQTFTHSFNKYLLSTPSLPSPGNTTVSKTYQPPAS